MYQASLYFNYPSFQDTLFLVIDQKEIPDTIKVHGDFVGLYHASKLIGVNIFNSNRYLKMKIAGLLSTPNQPLKTLIFSLIKENLQEEVELIGSEMYLAQIISKKNKGYRISLGKLENEAYPIEDENFNPGDFVLVVTKSSRLENGYLASDYIDGDYPYLIVAKEEQGEENAIGAPLTSLLIGSGKN